MHQKRVPVRLVFKHEKLEDLALKHLKSRTILALPQLSVNEFMTEVLEAMHAVGLVRKFRISIHFFGKSVRFPIHFEGRDNLQKVFKKICGIEESRERSQRLSPHEDSPKAGNSTLNMSAGEAEAKAQPESKTIVAEIRMQEYERSEGRPTTNQKRVRVKGSDGSQRQRRHNSRDSHDPEKENRRQRKAKSIKRKDESESSCRIF